MKYGSGERLVVTPILAPNTIHIGSLKVKVVGTGGMTGQQKNVTLAIGNFKYHQGREGGVITPVRAPGTKAGFSIIEF